MPATRLDRIVEVLTGEFGKPEYTDRYRWSIRSPGGFRPSISILVKAIGEGQEVNSWAFAPGVGEGWRFNRVLVSDTDLSELVHWVKEAVKDRPLPPGGPGAGHPSAGRRGVRRSL